VNPFVPKAKVKYSISIASVDPRQSLGEERGVMLIAPDVVWQWIPAVD
jgi:hypothetical protein